MYTAADMDSTVHFIEFFMNFVQDVSYGTREVTLSSVSYTHLTLPTKRIV